MRTWLAGIGAAWIGLGGQGAAAAELYSLTDLGDLPGGSDFSEALDLNDDGVVVGSSIRSIGPGAFDVARRGFVWENGVMTDVGDLPGGNDESHALAVNALGQVVGFSDATAGRRPFSWTASGGILDLTTVPDATLLTEAKDVNDAGQVVCTGPGASGNHAYLWEIDEPLVDLGTMPRNPAFSVPEAINASGLAVGWGSAGADLQDSIRGLVWATAGSPQDLGELVGGRDRSIAFDVSDTGRIVGRSESGAGELAVAWNGAAPPASLGELPGGDVYSEAFGVNEAGEIVGVSADASGNRAVLWDTTGGPYDLNDRLDASGAGWVIERATAINESGQIAANATLGAVSHGVLLTPVPEPGAASLAIPVAAALAAVGRARAAATRSRRPCAAR